MSELVVLNGACAGTVFFLPDVPTVVGRSPESHLQIADPWISSMHALFERREAELWVVDLESRNGTFVDDARVQEAKLAPGALLRFGKTEVRYHVRDEADRPERLLGDGRAVVRYLDDLQAELESARGPAPKRDTVRSDPAPHALARRQLAALEEIGRALVDAPDLDASLARTLAAVARAVSAERSSLLLADERGAMIPRVAVPPGAPAALSSTVIAAAAQSRAGILTTDARQDARFQASQSIIAQGIRSAMCVPLWAGQRILGMILLDKPLSDPFTAEDLDLVAVVAHQAALAIERVRWLEGDRAAEARRRAMAAALPPELARAEAEAGGEDGLELAPREVVVLHAELEGMDARPGELRAAVDAIASIALAEGGAVSPLAGRGVVAAFALTLEGPDGAERASRAAQAMRQAAAALVPSLSLRVGVAAGRALVGNVAGPTGFALAILGPAADSAATASRPVRPVPE